MGGEEEQWGAAVQPIYFLKNAVFVGRTSRLNPFRKGHLGDSGARQQRRQTVKLARQLAENNNESACCNY